jgi:hypothetical protein
VRDIDDPDYSETAPDVPFAERVRRALPNILVGG